MSFVEMPRIGILASGDRESGGGGSTADKFARDALEEKVKLDIAVVVCNNAVGTVGVYDRFEKINQEFGLKGDSRIEVVNISSATHPEGPQERGQTAAESSVICRLFEERGVTFAAMLGYMKLVTTEYEQTWCWQEEYGQTGDFTFRNGLYHPGSRTSNNHPGILPFTADTHGPVTHARAIELRDSVGLDHTAMTWHLASRKVDAGPIIAEVALPLLPDVTSDTIGEEVQHIEKELTAEVIANHIMLREEHLRLAA